MYIEKREVQMAKTEWIMLVQRLLKENKDKPGTGKEGKYVLRDAMKDAKPIYKGKAMTKSKGNGKKAQQGGAGPTTTAAASTAAASTAASIKDPLAGLGTSSMMNNSGPSSMMNNSGMMSNMKGLTSGMSNIKGLTSAAFGRNMAGGKSKRRKSGKGKTRRGGNHSKTGGRRKKKASRCATHKRR